MPNPVSGAGAARILPPSELGGGRRLDPSPSNIGAAGSAAAGGAQGTGFKETVSEFVDGVNALQHNSKAQFESFVRGEAELHDVAIAAHEASIAMRLTQEIRNRLIGAYQEVMRTQI